MGEFSALVCAGALSFEDAVRLVRARGQAMKSAGEKNPGSMAAVLGLDAETVSTVCSDVHAQSGHVIQLANDNCPGQYVISGSEAGMELAVDALKSVGARRVIPLAVSIAAHSALMEPAQAEFNEAVESTPLQAAQIPVYANVSGQPVSSIEDIQTELRAQLTSQVRWTESIQMMARDGIESFLELGPKDVLTKLCGRIDKSVTAQSFSEPGELPA